MAETSTTLSIILKLVDEASSGLRGFAEENRKGLQTIGVAAGAAFAGIAAYSTLAVKSATEAEAIQARLASTLRSSTNASDAQIDSLNKQAEALEKVGVVSADTIRYGQGQLAAFDLQTESIERLIPSILNYAVQEKGLNMTTGDLQAVTNGLAQALQGNFVSLTKTGFILDDATKKLLSTGTETERTAALVKVLDGTYAGLNENMRKTTEGGIIGMQFAMNNLNEAVGNALIPIIRELTSALVPILINFTAWAEKNPELLKWIILISGAITGMTAGLVALGFILPGITAALKVFGLVSSTAFLPLTAAAAAVLGLYAALKQLRTFLSGDANGNIFGGITLSNFVTSIPSGINSVIKGFGLPGFATGGVVNGPTLAMVGEAGPEAIIPLSKLGGMGGGVTVNVMGGYYMDQGAATQIGDMIARKIVQQTRTRNYAV